jgi:hypothetical protein
VRSLLAGARHLRLFAALAFAALALCLAAPRGAHAAEIAPIDSPYCNIILQGDIAVGDVEKFKLAVDRVAKTLADHLEMLAQNDLYRMKMREPAPTHSLEEEIRKKLGPPLKIQETGYEKFQRAEYASPSLEGEMWIVHVCLNSSGGSFDEAHKIIGHMTSGRGVATIVRAGDECFSACALIFMFGNMQTFGDNRFIDRRLDVRGKLGFHAPYINADNAVPREAAAAAYQAGIQAVADLLEDDKKGFINRALIVDFLRTGPEAFLNLDTVGKAGEWVVELMGYATPEDVTEAMFAQACENDIEWSARRRTSSSAGNFPSHFDQPGNWLKGKKAPPDVFPVTRMLDLDATHRLFTRPASNEENVKTDSTCCVVRAQKHENAVHRLAMRIEHEKTFDENSVCQKRAAPAAFNVPNKRPLVGDQGFLEQTPAWFLYPASTPLTAIAAH